MRKILLLLSLVLMLLAPIACDNDPVAECISYCDTYWEDGSLWYQQCVQDCAR